MNSQITDRDIGVEMRESFMDYAMSIIVSRALPDVRDGLEAGSPAYFVRDVRARHVTRISHIRSQPESSAKLSVSIILTVTLLFMRLWYGWHKISPCDICL